MIFGVDSTMRLLPMSLQRFVCTVWHWWGFGRTQSSSKHTFASSSKHQPHQEFLLIILLLESLSACWLVVYFLSHLLHFRWHTHYGQHTEYYIYDFDHKSHIATRYGTGYAHMVGASPVRCARTHTAANSFLLNCRMVEAPNSIDVTTRRNAHPLHGFCWVSLWWSVRGTACECAASKRVAYFVDQSSQNSLTMWKLIFHFLLFSFRQNRLYELRALTHTQHVNDIWRLRKFDLMLVIKFYDPNRL